MAPLHKCNDMGPSIGVRQCRFIPNDPTTVKPPTKPPTLTDATASTDSTTTSTTPGSDPTPQCTSKTFWACKARAYPDCWFCCWWIWLILILLVLLVSFSNFYIFPRDFKIIAVLLYCVCREACIACLCCPCRACCNSDDDDEQNFLSFDKIRRGTMIPDERNTFGGERERK